MSTDSVPGPFRCLLAGVVFVICTLIPAVRSGVHADTLRVLAVRADFQPDYDSTNTTGDGTFLLEAGDWDDYDVDFTEFPYDPPPHDGSYFASHLKAARRYLRAISYGEQDLVWTMYPGHADSTLHLPLMMREYYSKHKSSSLAAGDRQLRNLVKAVFAAIDSAAAAAGSTFSFSRYNAYIVFHAGADGRTDRDDRTYSDIPSKYVSFEQYADSVVTADGTVIRDCILLPETVTQDGRIGVLNGVLAYELCHQLKLPSLFYTEETANYGVPAVGLFSLMDIGGNAPDSGETYVYGTVPPFPGPWERIQMGWVEPVVLGTGQAGTYSVNPAVATAESSIYKILISDHEYFLIENRQRMMHAAADSQFVIDTATGVILGPAPAAGDTVEGYDALLPGDGLVIWHVDEREMDLDAVPPVINYGITRQGIDIIEADGVEELGYVFTYGTAGDMFGRGSRFTPYSDPASSSRSGAYTGISITAIDTAADNRMRFTVSFDRIRDGWPVTADTGAGGPLCADITGSGTAALFTVSSTGTVYAWQADGTRLTDTAGVNFGYLAAPPAGLPAAGDVDGNDTLDLWIADAAGSLHVFGMRSAAVTHQSIALGAACTGHPVLAPSLSGTASNVYQGTADGHLYRVTYDAIGNPVVVAAPDTATVPGAVRCAAGFVRAAYGSLNVVAAHGDGRVRLYNAALDTLYWEADLGAEVLHAPAICDLDRDNTSEIIVVAGGKLFALNAAGAVLAGWPAGSGLLSAPAAGDLDGNGYPDIFAAGAGHVYGFNRTGAALSGYPRQVDPEDASGGISVPPVLGDVDDAAGDELVAGAPGSDVYMFRNSTRYADDWPLATGGSVVRGGMLLCDLDGNDTVDVAAVTADRIYVWELNTATGGQWPMEAHDARRSGYYGPVSLGDISAGDPLSAVYNYPNPVKTGLTTIRYRVGRTGMKVSVELFDYAGELVDSFEGPAVPYEYNEIPYDVSGLQSGVYYCRVEADGAADREVRFCRIAVIK